MTTEAPVNEETAASETEAVTEEKAEKVSQPEEAESKELVVDYYANEGSYEIPNDEFDSYTFDFSYHIPMITDGSEDAEAFNKNIQEEFTFINDFLEPILKGEAEEVYDAEYSKISYDVYNNNDIVSIVVKVNYSYADWTEYKVFNYNKKEKKAVSNSDLLKFASMTEEDFYKYAGTAFGQVEAGYFKEMLEANKQNYPDEPEMAYNMVPSMIGDFVSTVRGIDLNKRTQIYLGENGALYAIDFVYVQAGAGMVNSVVEVKQCEDVDFNEMYKSVVEECHYDGFEKDCLDMYDLVGYKADGNITDDEGNTVKGEKYIGFDDKDSSIFLYQEYSEEAGTGRSYSGTLSFAGVNEKGIIFEYSLTHLDGKEIKDNRKTGKFSLITFSDYDESLEDYTHGAYYNFIDGEDLFDSEGKEVVLTRSIG